MENGEKSQLIKHFMKNNKVKILVIDQSFDYLQSIKGQILHVLPQAMVYFACNEFEVKKVALKEDINVILFNIDTSIMEGVSSCQNIKKVKRFADVPVVFVMSMDQINSPNSHLALNSGCQAFLHKPIIESELLAIIQTMQKMNITTRKLAKLSYIQKQLKASEDRYLPLYTALNQGLALHEALLDENGLVIDYRFLDVNPTYEIMTGLKKKDIAGKLVTEVIPNIEAIWIERYGHTAMTGEPVQFESFSKPLNKWFSVSAYCPKIGQFAVLVNDITERKQFEEKLKSNQKDLLESQKIAHIGTWRLNVATGAVAWTEELYKMYGFDPTIPPPPYTEHMKLFTPDSWNKLASSLALTQTKGIPYELELEMINKDGSTHGWMWVRGEAERDDAGEIIAIWGAAQDITARKKVEQTIHEQNIRFSSLFENMMSGSAIYQVINQGETGHDYIIRDFNKVALQIEHKQKEEVIGKSLFDLRPNIDEFGIIPILRRVWTTGVSEFFSAKAYKDNQFDSYYENEVFRLPSGDVVTIYNDVTEKMNLQARIIERENNLRATLNSIGDGVISTDRNGRIVAINMVAEKLTGCKHKESIGKLFDECFHIVCEGTGDTCDNPVKKVLETREIMELENHTILIAKDGTRHYIEDCASPIFNDVGDIKGVVLVFRDVTEKKKKQREIEYLSYHDYLTNLYNRRYYVEAFESYKSNKRLPLGIMMFDVNGLKIINDAYGHDVGDKALKEIAAILKQTFRKEDIVARIGGDEFAVILPNTNLEIMQSYKEVLKKNISQKPIANVILTLAIGYELMSDPNSSLDEMLKIAENHMYRHKLAEGVGVRNRAIQAILSTLTEKYEPEKIHSERVSYYCRQIGRALHLKQDDVKELTMAGMFHDIGKISIPDAILEKPKRLNLGEFDIIKTHTEIGYQILRAADQYSDLAIHALSHHEKWDGTGYPQGLVGDKIPLYSRIIGVADAFEAMTAIRPYRKAMTYEKATEELKRCAGTQFDPALVKLFVEEVLPKELAKEVHSK